MEAHARSMMPPNSADTINAIQELSKDIEKTRKLTQLHAVFRQAESSFDGSIDTAKPFEQDLVKFVTQRGEDLLKQLVGICPEDERNVQYFVDAVSISNEEIQALCLNKLYQFLLKQHKNDVGMSASVSKSIAAVFIDVLNNESHLEQHRDYALKSLDLMTQEQYMDNGFGEGDEEDGEVSCSIYARLARVLVRLLDSGDPTSPRRICGIELILKIIYNLWEEISDVYYIQEFQDRELLRALQCSLRSDVTLSYHSLQYLVHIYASMLQFHALNHQRSDCFASTFGDPILLGLLCRGDEESMIRMLTSCDNMWYDQDVMISWRTVIDDEQCPRRVQHFYAKKSECDQLIFDKKMKLYKKQCSLTIPESVGSLIFKFFRVDLESKTLLLWNQLVHIAFGPYSTRIRELSFELVIRMVDNCIYENSKLEELKELHSSSSSSNDDALRDQFESECTSLFKRTYSLHSIF